MFDSLRTVFTTLNSLSFGGNLTFTYVIGFFVGVPIIAYLLKKSK